MPYSLKKKYGKELYWVVDNQGKRLERLPITKKKAQKQIIAIYLSKIKIQKNRTNTSIKQEIFGKK